VGTVADVRRWGITERQFRLEVSDWREEVAAPFRIVSSEIVGGVRRVVVALEGDGRLDDLLKSVMAQGGRIESCDRIEPDLEEAFSRLLAAESARATA
jgi:hypothetical protein